MATTTEIPGIHSVPPPLNGSGSAAEVKRPRGRPQKCRQCGENIDPTKAHVCPPPPAAPEEPADEDFWITISNFTPEEWNHLTAYLYRVMPRIDRKANGKPINLGCYSTAFTRDDIMNEHGSGVYRIDVTQTEQASSRSRRIAREVFTIINPKYPPIVPPGDWVDDKVNDMWKWGAPAGTSNAGIAAGYPPGFNIENVMERQEKGLMMGIEMAKALTPAAPPAKDDSELYKLLGVLINRPVPEQPKPDDTATKALLSFLEKQNDRLAAEIKEMRTNPAVAANNPLAQLREWKPLIGEFVEVFAEKTGSQPWWAAPLEKLMEGVGEAIPTVVDMMKAGQQQQQRAAAPNAWTPQLPAATPGPQHTQPQQQQPAPVNAQLHVNAQAQPQPAAEQPNLTDEQRAFMEICRKWGMFVVQIAPQMIENFKHPDGYGGLDFRDWFLEWHGMLSWSNMRREIGPAVLGQMIGDHPQLSLEIFPEEARNGFCQQFFALPEEDQEEQTPGDGVIEIQGGSDAA